MRTLRCIDGETREPLAGVEAVGAGAEGSTPEGWLAVPAELDRVALSRDGYHGAVVVPGGRHAVVAMRPMLEGALHGRRIIVDPAGGPGGESTEAAEKNFEAAERLYHLLKAAGADAALTRGPNENPDRIERLLLTRGAELFLQVSYGEASGLERLLAASGYRREAPGAFVGHYPNSANGERMARHAAERLGGLPTTPSVSYLIQQTPCPAVLIRPAGEQSAEDAARGLYEAIALYYGVKSPR
jgi:N-acetylmuramoyl-L-alanine amidase